MDILETMKARHSVRQYKNQAIESSKREKINALIKDVNAESKLSIQVFYDEPKCFDSFMAHYGKFENVKNYIAIVGNKNDQEKAGYYGEKIVLKCQKLGLNTCWVAMTHGKSKAQIKRGQKLLLLSHWDMEKHREFHIKAKVSQNLDRRIRRTNGLKKVWKR